MKALLDTNICIYMIKNNPPEVREHFQRFALGDIAVSSITVAELQYGVAKSTAREKNSRALEMFLLPLEIAPFDLDAALAYGKIRAELERQGAPIGGMDLLIAAQAIAQKFTLVTHNLREFQRVSGLTCETWVNSRNRKIEINNAPATAIVTAQEAFSGASKDFDVADEDDMQSLVAEVRYGKGCK